MTTVVRCTRDCYASSLLEVKKQQKDAPLAPLEKIAIARNGLAATERLKHEFEESDKRFGQFELPNLEMWANMEANALKELLNEMNFDCSDVKKVLDLK